MKTKIAFIEAFRKIFEKRIKNNKELEKEFREDTKFLFKIPLINNGILTSYFTTIFELYA
jgi:hypothetical protein